MRKIIEVIVGVIIAEIVFVNIYWRQLDPSQFVNPQENISVLDGMSSSETGIEYGSEMESTSRKLWIDTIMYANGHSFGYSGDVFDWEGWYYDTVRVGYDRMLTYDSIGPTTLKLDLITRRITVDLGNSYAAEQIRNFLGPINGFKRFYKKYEECIDSTFYEDYGWEVRSGMCSLLVDYATVNLQNADIFNSCMLDLICRYCDIEMNVDNLPVLYKNTDSKQNKGNTLKKVDNDDLIALSDYIKDKTVEGWKDEDDHSMGADLAVTVHIANNQFVTFGVYNYSRIGSGHGGYSEMFHTFDMNSGNQLSNADIFKPKTLAKVKLLLFDVIANNPHYVAWNSGIKSVSDVQSRFEGKLMEGDSGFILPQGALTNTGVVFSFQPYEIGCWAEGTYHFIIPYKRLKPYLTTRVKDLIYGVYLCT